MADAIGVIATEAIEAGASWQPVFVALRRVQEREIGGASTSMTSTCVQGG